MKIISRALALLFLVTSAATAQPAPNWDDLLPPALPWRGKCERLIVKADDPWITRVGWMPADDSAPMSNMACDSIALRHLGTQPSLPVDRSAGNNM